MSNTYVVFTLILTNMLFLPCLVLADLISGEPKVAFAASAAYTIGALVTFMVRTVREFGAGTREQAAAAN